MDWTGWDEAQIRRQRLPWLQDIITAHNVRLTVMARQIAPPGGEDAPRTPRKERPRQAITRRVAPPGVDD